MRKIIEDIRKYGLWYWLTELKHRPRHVNTGHYNVNGKDINTHH